MLTLSQLVELKISTVVLLEKDNIVESINNFCAILSTYTKDKKDNFLQIDSVIDNTLLEYDKIKYQSDSIKNKLNVIIENINVAIEEEINKLNHSDVFKKTFDTGWSNIFLLDTAVNNLIEITLKSRLCNHLYIKRILFACRLPKFQYIFYFYFCIL